MKGKAVRGAWQRSRWALVGALVAVACAPPASGPPSFARALEEARRAADGTAPGVTELRRAAALALLEGGDPALARRYAEGAVALAPEDGRARYEAAWVAAFLDDPDGVLAHASVAALEMPRAAPERAVALLLLRSEARWAEGYEERAGALFGELMARPDEDADVLDEARKGLDELARAAGDDAQAAALTAARGVLTRFRVAAPFESGGVEGFDRTLPPDGTPTALPAELTWSDAGWPRSVVTTERSFSDGELYFPELRQAGVGFGEGTFSLDREGAVELHAESPAAARVSVDGVEVLAFDGVRALVPTHAHAAVRVGAGVHRVRVELAQGGSGAWVRVRVAPAEAGLAVQVDVPGDAAADTRVARLDDPQSLPERLAAPPLSPAAPEAVYDSLARWFVAIQPDWFDRARAEAAARDVSELAPRSFAAWQVLGLTLLHDRDVPPEVARSRARAAFAEAVRAAPTYVPALYQLAAIEQEDGRRTEALSMADRALAIRTDHPDVLRLRLALLDSLDWLAEAEAAYEALVRVPLSPHTVLAALSFDTRRGRWGDAAALASRWRERAPGEAREPLATIAWGRGDYDAAEADLATLGAARPEDVQVSRHGIELARARGDVAAERTLLVAHLARFPDDVWALRRLGERAWLDGAKDEAMAVWARLLTAHPEASTVRELVADLEGLPLVLPPIPDARAWIRDYEAAVAREAVLATWGDQPGVTVLDDSDVRVFEDGSALSVRHIIRRIQTKKLADASGEFAPPPGAVLLEARTLRADGSVREPELDQGKGELSFSGLTPGDYMELRVLRFEPTRRRVGGLVGSCSASTWGLPTFALQCRFDAPAALALEVTARNGMPRPARTSAGGRETLAWSLRHVAALPAEPFSAPPPEFLPHALVRDGRLPEPEAWEAVTLAHRASLGPLLRPTPELVRFARGLAAGRDADAAMRAAYAFVRDEITPSGSGADLDVAAGETLAARKGSPTILLLALLRAMGYDPTLYRCHPTLDARLPHMVPTPDAFWYPVVGVGAGGARTWLDLVERFTPFGHVHEGVRGAECLAVVGPEAGGVAVVPIAAAAGGDGDGWRFEVALALTPDGDATGSLRGVGRGLAAAPLRKTLLAGKPSERRMLVEEWLRRSLPGVQVEELTFEALEEADRPATLTARLRVSALLERRGWRLEGGPLFANTLGHLLVGVPSLPDYLRVPDRRNPLRLEPLHEILDLTLELPDGARFESAPAPFREAGPGATFAQEVELDDTRLHLLRTVEVAEGRVSVEGFPALGAFVQHALRAAMAPVVVLLDGGD